MPIKKPVKRPAPRKIGYANFTVVIEPDGDEFHAFAPALPGCHTFGATLDETRLNIIEAMQLHIECLLEDGETLPVEGEPLIITRLSMPVAG
jgi:predicted RNase H-like HicB family nuclease